MIFVAIFLVLVGVWILWRPELVWNLTDRDQERTPIFPKEFNPAL